MKIITVVGARPQFVKAATVTRELKDCFPAVKEILIHTGQHYDANMSDVFFDELHIPKPDYCLGVGGGGHGQNTGRMLEKLEVLMSQIMPDLVLVYGDTDSTLAGALAASKLHIPIAHVEAGLRSFNRRMPEEINRVLTDHMADYLFAPTDAARRNLQREGIPDGKVHVVGDVMYDAVLHCKKMARRPQWLDALGVGDFILCTIHRAENTDSLERMSEIMYGLGRSDLPIILPMHPRTKKQLAKFAIMSPANVLTVDPVGYLEMIWLEENCNFIVTDSGGVQKEAYFHGKPCITLRDETEWVELVDAGVNILTGSNGEKIYMAMNNISPILIEKQNMYGCGDSAKRLCQILFG